MTGANSRPAYFDGMELSRGDLVSQKTYLDALRQAYCSGLHTWGVACGLDTERSSDGRVVSIAPGLAITRTGREAVVPGPLLHPVPDSGAGTYDLFLGVHTLPADPSSSSLTLGFKRQVSQPVARFVARGGGVPADSVFLAAITLDARGIVQDLDASARRYCGLYGSAVGFRIAPAGDVSARLEAIALPGGPGMGVVGDIVAFSGSVTVAGGFSLSDRPRLAAFDLVSDGPLVSIRNNADDNVLDTDADGRSWIGTASQAARTARLTVNGDIALDAGYALRFDPKGEIRWNDGAESLALDDTAIVLKSQAGMALDAGGGKTVWTFAADGNTGINIAQPGYALSVAGAVQSIGGGFEFSDGYVQNTAANSTSVMVGAIVDWWRPDTSWEFPPEYAICDGSVVSDPQSPLHGQTLPDLEGLYIVGTDQSSQIGVTERTPTHTHQIDSIPVHDHPILHTHNVSGYVDAADDDGDSDSSDDDCTKKHHTHYVDELIEQNSQPNSSQNADTQTPVTTSANATSPPSIGLLKLMRIK